MIRPITLLMFVLACGSGMFLYNEKHRTHVLDQQIDQTIKQTDALREQTRALHAEWMLMNDPDRLRRLSGQYLPTLQPVAPTQFTDLADLDARLPAPVAPTAPPPAPVVAAAPDQTQVAADAKAIDPQAAGAQTADTGQSGTHSEGTQTADALPMPPAAPLVPPPAQPVQIATAPTPDRDRPAPRPVVAQATLPRPQPVAAASERPSPWRPAAPHSAVAEATPPSYLRPAPRPMPVYAARPQPVATPAAPAFSGSMLGMAHSTQNLPAPQPLPRPVPMNAAFSTSAGG